METTTSSTQETKDLAQQLAPKLKSGDVLALYGDLGSGKTTFVRYLTESMGFLDRVQSPTFVIMRKYYSSSRKTPIEAIYHLDLYRLTEKEDIENIGLSELLEEKNSVIIIEWPDAAESFLPDKTIRIYFENVAENENARKIKIQNLS